MAHSRGPNGPLMRSERGFQRNVNPVTTVAQCSSSGSSVRSRCCDGEQPVPLGGRNQRALLTLLLLRANEPVSTERLVDQLWGEHPPRTATTSLQNSVSQLRKLLGPGFLQTTADRLRARARPRVSSISPVSSDSSAQAREEEPERTGAPAPRGACALARRGACRLGARGLRAGRDPSARGSAAAAYSRTDRRRSRARRRRRARGRAGVARPRGIRCGSGCARS